MSVENESFTTADLRLCFRICRLLVFLCSGSYFTSLHNEIATRERPFDFYGGGAGRKKKSNTPVNNFSHVGTGSVRFGSATRTQNFEREVFFIISRISHCFCL